ncbi:DUF5655 domain-containing protein [Sulfitobacter sp. M39]|jgi:predicted transport protein|uniref:DUF5655 domain-containing protein n=1 Tax=Sulfitobacter sp. M39 TaxID=2675334 RepID=UPI001F29EF0C|nr:DUF5655 domain-containing protein [Sulfitobacter sp. M39]
MKVINQGLLYLDWLVTHRGDFEMLVLKTFGVEAAQSVEWSSPRLICIAGDFSKFDEHAIKQMNRNIDLLRYVRFGDDLLLLEQINAAVSLSTAATTVTGNNSAAAKAKYITVTDYPSKADTGLTDLYLASKDYLMGLGDGVQHKTLKNYFAFERIKNFACVEVKNQDKKVVLYLKMNPDTVELIDGFTRNVRKIGHFGTGDLEVTVRSLSDMEKAMPLIEQSYESA